MSSDIKHWYLNATVFKDRVEEIHYISDPSKGVRRRQQTRVWHVERFLGRGGFGEVRLERDGVDGNVRAVKRITTMSTNLSNSECEKELTALLEFSKPKVRPPTTAQTAKRTILTTSSHSLAKLRCSSTFSAGSRMGPMFSLRWSMFP
jgi:hypothetical protein